MAIPSGTRLGPYEVASLIGAGGMGEVYSARDTRLDRTVAIKVLLAPMAERADVRERFDREARTIASLNHPHICALYDLGHQDGVDYLVMEHLEGETLAQRLRKGPLPLEETLRYAAEIADALDKAHAKGITHRDLKPGNIMLIKSGTKLLDFGLAKLKQEAAPPAVPVSQLSTLTNLPTAHSGIVGTLQYMSPEQLEGQAVDGRTDIFAFGAVLYEMATGKKAFDGATQASLISAILTANPAPISAVQPMTPAALDRVVKKCLAKEPDKRWQTARDLSDELKWIAESDTRPVAQAATSRTAVAGTNLRRWGWSAALAGLVVVLAGGWAYRSARPKQTAISSSSVARSVFNLPAGDQLAGLGRPAVVLSPDGRSLVYVATRNGVQQLFLRPMDSFEAKPISGTEGGAGPFFSPDGQWIGFIVPGGLKKVSLGGGTPITLAGPALPGEIESATWGVDETIIFSLAEGDLWRVPASGGQPQRLNALAGNGELSTRSPTFLPKARGVLFSSVFGATLPAIKVRDLINNGQQKTLSESGAYPRYASSGHLVYSQPGVLMAAPFDLDRLEVTRAGVPVIEGVLGGALGATGVFGVQYSISDNGSLVYVPGPSQAAQDTLVWVDHKGQEQPLGAQTSSYVNPRISPDGRRIAVGGLGAGISIYDITRGTLTRLTFDTAGNPIWTPDGKRVTFQTGTPPNLFWQVADGSAPAERLGTSQQRQASNSWSSDGQSLAYSETSSAGSDIFILRLNDHKAEPFLNASYNEGAAKFSPDGRFMAYASDESGRWEVYVRSLPGTGGKWQASTDGGKEPVWNPNGRELFYRNGDKMMATDVTTQPGFSLGKPRVLFEGKYRPTNAAIAAYDVSPDGQRFLMVKQGALSTATPTQIYVVQNWFEELKARVPTGSK